MKKSLISASIITASLTLVACGGSSSSNSTPAQPTYAFKVEVSNLTHAQPLSPPAIVAHSSNYQMFDEASRASVALEHLAESGSNAQIIAEANNNTETYASEAATALITPGGQANYTLAFDEPLADAKVSVATMLVNTNDAFTGQKNIDISALEINASIRVSGPVWDAGTEGNSETAATIPGPVGESPDDSHKAFDGDRSYRQ